MGDFFLDSIYRLRDYFTEQSATAKDEEPIGPVDLECEEIERKHQSAFLFRDPYRYYLEDKLVQCRARSEGWAEAKREAEPKRSSFLSNLFSSDDERSFVGMGLLVFCPWLVPLAKAQASLPLPDFVKDLNLSFDGFLESFKAFNQKTAENRKKFEEEIEGAIRNPALDDLNQGDLFVFDEAGLNDLITELLSQGKQKVRNVKVKIDGDRLKISGEYDHWAGWIDFTAVAEFEQKNGESSGYVKKVEAIGMDLTDNVKNDLLAAFRNFG
ncbi:MAG TPA: hypothetical protein VJR29_14415, partial [bacterium]|nr:hypothetical protein [bacterium]